MSGALPEKLTVSQLVHNFPFVEPESSLFSEELANGPNPEPDKFIPHPQILYF
jgi:hypothetical protein